jgi:hypothetical protein
MMEHGTELMMVLFIHWQVHQLAHQLLPPCCSMSEFLLQHLLLLPLTELEIDSTELLQAFQMSGQQ